MKDEINQILKKNGVEPSRVYFGNGASGENSEIHLNLNAYREKLRDKVFAIQFEKETQTLAIWDLRDRLKVSHASLDLYFENEWKWRQIDGVYKYEAEINTPDGKRSGVSTRVIAIPLDELEDYLQCDADVVKPMTEVPEASADSLTSTRIEGGKVTYYGTRYERNPKLRKEAIEAHGYRCAACGLEFEKVYGCLGEKYIEVHHIKPLSLYKGSHEVNAETDMVCLCANCHRMIHRCNGGTLTVDELKEHLVR